MKILKPYLLLAFITLFVSCKTLSPGEVVTQKFPSFLVEGHRGARGEMPENTIPAMIKAVDDGANTLELDVQISKDDKVVVAHDPFINRGFSLMPNGDEIKEEDAQKYLLYQMNYNRIKEFDVGTKVNKRFPKQKSMKAHIPLLADLIEAVEKYTESNNIPGVIYNVEIKSNPRKDGTYQPAPRKFVRLVMDVLQNKNINERFYIQSFDVRQIQRVRERYPNVPVGFLTGDKNVTFEENIAKSGFVPEIYSPHFSLASRDLIKKCHDRNIKFIPWTVNTREEIERLKKMNVDGIITDFPHFLK